MFNLDLVCFGMARFALALYGLLFCLFHMTWFGMVWFGLFFASHDLVWFGWFGHAWVWFGALITLVLP